MKIKVLFFALGRELVGAEELTVDLPEGATAAVLMAHIKETYPRFRELPSYMIAVNMTFAEAGTVLNAGDEVAIIPPVSGG